jgi:hypothetical protein
MDTEAALAQELAGEFDIVELEPRHTTAPNDQFIGLGSGGLGFGGLGFRGLGFGT